MNEVNIYSRIAMEHLIQSKKFPFNTAVICFYDPVDKNDDYQPIDYYGICDDVYYVEIQDISLEELDEYGYTLESYFDEVSELAEFIKESWYKGLNIICQCEHGQSRSAACAAAIKEYYSSNGINVFADYRYSPNQLIFNKLLDALRNPDTESNF